MIVDVAALFFHLLVAERPAGVVVPSVVMVISSRNPRVIVVVAALNIVNNVTGTSTDVGILTCSFAGGCLRSRVKLSK